MLLQNTLIKSSLTKQAQKGKKTAFVLQYNDCIKSGERKINDNALTALALLIAESAPKDKEVMIKVVKSLITE